MHELGITEGILRRAREAAVAAGAVRIIAAHVVITPAADFTRDSIEMYFEMLTADDELFRGARLLWQEAPAQAACLECATEFEAREARPACPQCGSRQVRFDPDSPMIQLTDVSIAEADDADDESGGA